MRKIVQIVLCVLSIQCLAQDIDNIEYWIDVDPGLGEGIELDGINASEDIADYFFSLAEIDLSLGSHVIGIRSQDANGTWSHTNFLNFQVVEDFTEEVDIGTIEYWINSDPGFGEATQIEGFTVGQDVSDLFETIVLSEELALGNHVIGFRSKDADDKWSHTNFVNIRVKTEPIALDMVKFEFFWQSDDGFGNETIVQVPSPSPDISNEWLSIDVPIDAAVGDTLYLFARSKDEEGKWSHTNKVDSVVFFPLADGTINEEVLECVEWTSPEGIVINYDTLFCTGLIEDEEYQTYCYDLTIVEEIDTVLSSIDGTLTVGSPIGEYQWFDCETMMDIPGATGQSFTPEESGSYAVTVFINEDCIATSECAIILSADDMPLSSVFQYYPNPAKSSLTVNVENLQKDNRLNILDIQGRVLISQRLFQGIQELELPNLSAGTYILLFTNEDMMYTQKLVIEN